MRILALTSSYPVPGSPLGPFIEYLNTSLVKKGSFVRVLIFSADGTLQKYNRNGIEIIAYPYSGFFPPKLHVGRALLNSMKVSFLARLEFPFYLMATMRYLVRYAKDCDVIHCHWYLPAGLLAILTRPFHKKPVVVTAWGKEFHLPKSFWFKRVLNLVNQKADACTAVSKYLRSQAAPYGLDVDKIQVIPNGIDADRFNKPRESHSGGKVILSYACRLVPEKRAADVIKAYSMLLASHPPCETELWIAGHGEEYESLNQMARDLGIFDRIKFWGYLEPDEMPGFYARTDIFINPTQEEGMATNNIEAMGAGTIVVATRGVGNDEVVDEGKTGFCFSIGDLDDLVRILNDLLKNKDTWPQIREAGQRRAREVFGIDAVADKFLDLFKTVLNKD